MAFGGAGGPFRWRRRPLRSYDRPVFRMATLVMALLATVGTSACDGCNETSAQAVQAAHQADADRAREVAAQMLAAARRQDCDTIEQIVVPRSGDAPQEVCERLVERFGPPDVHTEILEATVDGRNPNAVLVRTRRTGGPELPDMQLRLERVDGSWKLIF